MASDSEASCVSDPNFAVICSFLEKFGASCGITSPDFLELQEMLENTQEVSPELIDLHVKLLRKVRRSVSVDRWERVLIKLCHIYCSQDAWELERFGYKKARLSSKLRVLKILMEIQFDLNPKFKAEVNRLTANELRTEPIGRDKHGHSYWYQIDESCQLRVYREDPDEETWALVANDREGLVRLISQLASDDPNLAENVLNEDSNSLEIEKPILDTGQNSSEVDESSGGNEDSKDIPSEPQTEETSPIESSPIETSPVETSNTETSATENTTPAEEKIVINPTIMKHNIEQPENLAVNDVKKKNIKLDTSTGIDLSVPQSSILQQTRGVELLNKRKKSINDLAANLRMKNQDMLYKNPVQEQEIDLSVKKPRMDPKQFSSLSVPPFEPMSIESALRMSTDFAESDEELEDEEDEYYDEDEIELPSHMKQPRLDRPTLLGNTKKKTYSDEEDEYGEEIEEPIMLIQGEGSGKECENENIQINKSEEYSDAVEEPVMYVYGEGSGYECDTGNTGKEDEGTTSSDKNSNDSESANTLDSVCVKEQDSDLTVKDTKSVTSSKTVLEKTKQCVDSDIKCVSTVCENKGKELSPKSNKIGTVMLDVKSSDRGHTSDPICSKKSSRWDIGKPADGDLLKNKDDASTKSELCNDSTNSSIKNKENLEVKLLKDETDNTISDIITDVNTKSDLEILDKCKQDTDKPDNKNNLTVHTSADTQEALIDEKSEDVKKETTKQPMFFFGPGCFQFKTPMAPYTPDVKKVNINKPDQLQNITDQESVTNTEKINTISESVPTCINKADILVDSTEQITNTKSSEQECLDDSNLNENIETKEIIVTKKETCSETVLSSPEEKVAQNVDIPVEIKEPVTEIESNQDVDNKNIMPTENEELCEIDNNPKENIENSKKDISEVENLSSTIEENKTSEENTNSDETNTESLQNNEELQYTTQDEMVSNETINNTDIKLENTTENPNKDEVENLNDNNIPEEENKIEIDNSNEVEEKMEVDANDSDKEMENMEIIAEDSDNEKEKMEIETKKDLDSSIDSTKEFKESTVKEQSELNTNTIKEEKSDVVIDELEDIKSETSSQNLTQDEIALETNMKESIESVTENTDINSTEEKSTVVTQESQETISETSSHNIEQESSPTSNTEINTETQCSEIETSSTKTEETTSEENKVIETEINIDVTSLPKKQEEITDDKSETLSETLESLSTLIETKSDESDDQIVKSVINKQNVEYPSSNTEGELNIIDSQSTENDSASSKEDITNKSDERNEVIMEDTISEKSESTNKNEVVLSTENDVKTQEMSTELSDSKKSDLTDEPNSVASEDNETTEKDISDKTEESIPSQISEELSVKSEITSSLEPDESDNTNTTDDISSNITEEIQEIASTDTTEHVKEVSSSVASTSSDIVDDVSSNTVEEVKEIDPPTVSDNVKEITSSIEIIEKDISDSEENIITSNTTDEIKEIAASIITEEVKEITSSVETDQKDNCNTVEEITSSNNVTEEEIEISSSMVTSEQPIDTNELDKEIPQSLASVEEKDFIAKECDSSTLEENKDIDSTKHMEEITTTVEENETIKSESKIEMETDSNDTKSEQDSDLIVTDTKSATCSKTEFEKTEQNVDSDIKCIDDNDSKADTDKENQEFVSSTASVVDDVQSVSENIDTSEDMEIDDIEISNNITEYKSNTKDQENKITDNVLHETQSTCITDASITNEIDEKTNIFEKENNSAIINETDINTNKELEVIKQKNDEENNECKENITSNIARETSLPKNEESIKINTENKNDNTKLKPELSEMETPESIQTVDSKETTYVIESENEVNELEYGTNSEYSETNTQVDNLISKCDKNTSDSVEQDIKTDEVENTIPIQDDKILQTKIDNVTRDSLDSSVQSSKQDIEKNEICNNTSIDAVNDTIEIKKTTENITLTEIKTPSIDLSKDEKQNKADDLMNVVNEQHVIPIEIELLKNKDVDVPSDITNLSLNSTVGNTKLNSNIEIKKINLYVQKESEKDKEFVDINHVRIQNSMEIMELNKIQENIININKHVECVKETIDISESTDNIGKNNDSKKIKTIEFNTLEPHISKENRKIDSTIQKKENTLGEVVVNVEKEIKNTVPKEKSESDVFFDKLKLNDQITICKITPSKKINTESKSLLEKKEDSSDDDMMDSCAFDEGNDFNDESDNEENIDSVKNKIHIIEQRLNHTEIKVQGTDNKIVIKDIKDLIEDKSKFLDEKCVTMKSEVIVNKAEVTTKVIQNKSKNIEITKKNNLKVDKSKNKTKKEKTSPVLTCVDITKLQEMPSHKPENRKIAELKQKPNIPSPTTLESIAIDNDDSNDVIDVPETDPLACTEEEILMSKTLEEETQSKPPGLSLATFKLDDTEDTDTSALIPEPIARALRNRKISIEATHVKNRKRNSDSAIEAPSGKKSKRRTRRSMNITAQPDSSSEEENIDENENPPEVKVTPQRGTGKARRGRGRGRGRTSTEKAQNDSPVVSSDPQSEPSRAEVVASPVEKKPPVVKKKRRVLGLDIDPAAIIQPEGKEDCEEPTTRSSIRQSRRIAQLKIKEEAERRKIEELTQIDIKEEKKKKKKDDDKDYKAEKKKKKYKSEDEESEDEVLETSVRKHKKKRKHQDLKKLFNMANPWQSSSESSTSHEEEEDEEVEEEPSDEEAVLKSDHEFSPESDLENNVEVQPLRRARTVKKESDTEEPTDEHACQKCGKADHPEWILLCDKCDCGWHCSCLRPALLVIPEGDWFCPPCQHVSLVEALKSQLVDFDKKMNRREMEVRRKQRLAYVGISLDNVLPSKETEGVKQEDEDNDQDQEMGSADESSESESGSESGSSSGDESEPIYQLRERRQAHSYRFNDYDELINSAIQDELEAVKGAGNQGRGKDIATIVNAEKEEAKAQEALLEQQIQQPVIEQPPPVVPVYEDKVVPQIEPEPSEEDSDDERPRVVPKHMGRKKHRKLNSLDISSEDDPDDDEDFKGTSASEEEDFEDLGSEDSDELDIGKRGKGKGATRRSTRARTTRYDREFINDDSEDEPPKRKRSKSMWDESESEESDKSWGRKKRSKKQRQFSLPKSSKKSRKKKRRIDDSDPEVKGRPKKPKIKFGGLNDSDDEELLTRRTRGKKINYIDALGSDSDEDKRKPKPIESEDEYVANEEEDDDPEEAVVEEEEKDSESDSDKLPMQRKIIKIIAPSKAGRGRGKGGIPRPQHLKQVTPTPLMIQEPDLMDETLEDMEDEEEEMEEEDEEDDEMVPRVPANIPVIAANPDDLNEEEVGTMMMENEEYAKKQLELMAIQLAKEKKKKEKEAKKLAEKKEIPIPPVVIPPPVVGPKKRGRKKKSEIEAAKLAAAQQQAGISPITVNPAFMQHPGDPNKLNPMLPMNVSPEIPATVPTVVSDLSNSPPKRRGRGKGKKTLAAEAAAAATTSPTIPTSQPPSGTTSPNLIPPQPTPVLTSTTVNSPNMNAIPNMSIPTSVSNDPQNLSNPNIHGKLGIAAPPQPFSQNQPTPSVITRMLQSQPISAQTFTSSANAMNQKYFPPGMPPDQQPPRGSPSGQFSPIAGRGRVPSPYRQSPPAMGMYPGVRPMAPNSPHRLRSPGPPNMQMFHSTHHSMDPSPSGGGPINIAPNNRDRNSPGNVGSPMTSKEGPTPPPPPYSRTLTVNRFSPNESSPGPSLPPPIRHHMFPQTGAHMQQPSPPPRPPPPGNFSPYHPPPPPNYHYGAYPPAPSLAAADDALPPTDYQGSPYPEHYNTAEGTVHSSEGSNSKPFDEEGSGEFGGLVSYFSSQREDDLDT